MSGVCAAHDEGRCGSCPHLDVPRREQQRRRVESLHALLPQLPLHAWEDPYVGPALGYRNKAKLAVSGHWQNPRLGLADRYGRREDLRDCPLYESAITQALPVIAQTITELRWEPYDVPSRQGDLKFVLLTAAPSGDLMLRWVARSDAMLAALRDRMPVLQQRLPALQVISLNVHPTHQATLEGAQEHLLTQRTELRMDCLVARADQPEERHEIPLFVRPQAFFQTNTAAAQELYSTAARWSYDAAPASVLDLFCGVGGFALSVAAPGRRVWGVEVSEQAISAAQRSAQLMGCDPALVRFAAGDAHRFDPRRGTCPEMLIVNPPRRGIGQQLAERLEESQVQRVIYSSCNPASLAQDCARMPSLEMRRARLVDMFPHTEHCEVIVELVRR